MRKKQVLSALSIMIIGTISLFGCSVTKTTTDTNNRTEEYDAIETVTPTSTVNMDIDKINYVVVYYHGHYSNCQNTETNVNEISDYQLSKNGNFRFTNWYDHCNEQSVTGEFSEKTVNEVFSILKDCPFYEYDPYYQSKDGLFINKFYPNVIAIDNGCYQIPKEKYIELLDKMDSLKQAIVSYDNR